MDRIWIMFIHKEIYKNKFRNKVTSAYSNNRVWVLGELNGQKSRNIYQINVKKIELIQLIHPFDRRGGVETRPLKLLEHTMLSDMQFWIREG